ncbi:MAG: oligosaccharide flippase family protein [Marinovum algicola]
MINGKLQDKNGERSFHYKYFSAVAWATVGSWSQFIISAIALVLMARELGPDLFGINAAAWIVIGVGQVILSGSLSQSLIQRPKIESGHFDAIFWTGFVLSALISYLVLIYSDNIENLIKVSKVSDVLSISIFLLPIFAAHSVSEAILLRDINFKSINIINSIGLAIGNFAGLLLAYNGAGVWSLVSIPLISNIVRLFSVSYLTRWTPGIACRQRHFRDLLSFNVNILLNKIIVYIDQNIPRIVIAITLGEQSLGLYALGIRIFETVSSAFLNPIVSAVLPGFSRAKEKGENIIRLYTKTTKMMMIGGAPAYFGLIGVAPISIPLIFGSQWEPATAAIQALAALGIMRTLTAIKGEMLRAFGCPEQPLFVAFVSLILCIIFVPPTASFGVAAVCIALVARTLAVWPLSAWYLQRTCKIGIRYQILPAIPFTISALLMSILVWAGGVVLESELSSISIFLIQIFIGIFIYFLLIIIQLTDLRSLFMLLLRSFIKLDFKNIFYLLKTFTVQ